MHVATMLHPAQCLAFDSRASKCSCCALQLFLKLRRLLCRYVFIAMEALDQLLVSCHAHSLNLFVESYLKMVQKLLECSEPDLQITATSSVSAQLYVWFARCLCVLFFHCVMRLVLLCSFLVWVFVSRRCFVSRRFLCVCGCFLLFVCVLLVSDVCVSEYQHICLWLELFVCCLLVMFV